MTAVDRDWARSEVLAWIKLEREQYSDVKYAEDGDNRAMLKQAMRDGDWQRWTDFAGNYIRRSELYGLDTYEGRQALGKALVTLMHCLETAIEIHGTMPKPGVTSGEIEMWE